MPVMKNHPNPNTNVLKKLRLVLSEAKYGMCLNDRYRQPATNAIVKPSAGNHQLLYPASIIS